MNDQLHETYKGRQIAVFVCWCGNKYYTSQSQVDNCTHTFDELEDQEKEARIENTFE